MPSNCQYSNIWIVNVLIIEPTVESEYTKLVSVFQKEEPLLLRRAARDIKSFGMAVSRQEIFVVNHYFDDEKLFFDHYSSSYGNGTIDEISSNELRQIIGDKIFDSPIIVEDHCKIMRINMRAFGLASISDLK